MKEKLRRTPIGQSYGKLLAMIFVIAATVTGIRAQSVSDEDAVRTRLSRARALAAAHNLAAAANELDSIRKTTNDDSIRDVARLMLMGICLEEGNYMRAQALLDELYVARLSQNESTTEAYFALAGQALNGAREHIERYRSFGISVTDKDLPADAISDLDRLRALLEKIANQAREMSAGETGVSAAAALLEDVSSLRASIARNAQERQQWQREMASARQKLSAEEVRMTPVSGTLNSPRPMPAARADNTGSAGNGAADNSQSRTGSPATVMSTTPATKAVDEKRNEQPQPPPVAAGTTPSGSAKSEDGKPVNVGSLIEKATQKINPSYPQTAKTARITGVVTVYVEVDPTGIVSTVQSTSGPMLLRQAASEAARRWKFRPTMVDGQAVRVVGFINFNFTL